MQLKSGAAGPGVDNVRRILEPGANCWVKSEASQAGVLVDARDYYRAFYRAARRARQYIAITGWQFDSDVALLRGEDSQGAGEVRMLPLLRELCEQNPELHIYILAWDFSLLLALEREWMQQTIFNWRRRPDSLPLRCLGSRCPARTTRSWCSLTASWPSPAAWTSVTAAGTTGTTRRIRSCAATRAEIPHGPYHDVQAVLTGPVVERLTELFEARWFNSGGGPLKLPRRCPVMMWRWRPRCCCRRDRWRSAAPSARRWCPSRSPSRRSAGSTWMPSTPPSASSMWRTSTSPRAPSSRR